MLGRDTKWRQGALLTTDDAQALALSEDLGPDVQVVVISHDCDLANDAEEFVEILVGSSVPASDRMFAGARNPRRLHLTFDSTDGGLLHVELRHANRQMIRKDRFVTLLNAEQAFTLKPDEKRTLKQWLAARYGRPAFPNAFEKHLRKKVGKKTVEELIAKVLEPASLHLVGLFFDLGEDKGMEMPEGNPYGLSISVVYDATEGGAVARHTAEEMAEDLRKIFEQAYGKAETATEIAFDACIAVADTKITLADLRRVDQWRLEYISLRESPPGPFFSAGNQPV